MRSEEEVLVGILPSPAGRGAGGEGLNVRNSPTGGLDTRPPLSRRERGFTPRQRELLAPRRPGY